MNKVEVVSPFGYIHFSFLTNILLLAAGNLLRFPGNNPVQTEGEPAISYTGSNPRGLSHQCMLILDLYRQGSDCLWANQLCCCTYDFWHPTLPKSSSSFSNSRNVAAFVPNSFRATV